MTNITEAATKGYESVDINRNPFIFSSPNFYAYEAGQTLRRKGYTQPVKASMGRGYSVNVWTAANRFKVSFPKENLAGVPLVERLGE